MACVFVCLGLQLNYLQAMLGNGCYFLGALQNSESTARPTSWPLWTLISTLSSKEGWREKQHPFYSNWLGLPVRLSSLGPPWDLGNPARHLSHTDVTEKLLPHPSFPRAAEGIPTGRTVWLRHSCDITHFKVFGRSVTSIFYLTRFWTKFAWQMF